MLDLLSKKKIVFFVYIVLLLYQKPVSSYMDTSILNDGILNNFIKSDIEYMGNHLSFNDNNSSNKRKKRTDSSDSDLLLLNILSEIIPSNFSVYSVSYYDGIIDVNDNINNVPSIDDNTTVYTINANPFIDLTNMYNSEFINTVTEFLNKSEPIKGCEEDINTYNCHENVLSCISLKKNYLSESCKKKLNNSLLYSCNDDISRYCDSNNTKFSKIYKCLKKNFYHITHDCLNILSYYENVMQKLHEVKNKPYSLQNHLFLEDYNDNNYLKTENATITTTTTTTDNSTNKNNNKSHNLKDTNKQNNQQTNNNNNNNNNNGVNNTKPTMVENLRKGYGQYFLPKTTQNFLFNYNSQTNYKYRYVISFIKYFLIMLILYIFVVYIIKYYVKDSLRLFGNNTQEKLAQL
ncbi:conserved protein, unknown function [Hepatocystis sp. ex Piliocolobus tephrosceles]|nr:conserved protein, unknown function [Hepatocystis sp. ex Piliocolobus tephrosceles]